MKTLERALKTLAEMPVESIVNRSPWIPASNPPPENPDYVKKLMGNRSDRVLVYAPGWSPPIQFGCYYHWNDDSEWRVEGTNGAQNVTHWMPEPTTPKSGK